MNSKSKKFIILLVPAVILILVAMVFAIYINRRASTIGAEIGKINGTIVGTAIGSVRGVTEGIESGSEDGESAGLSAEDTSVDLKGTMESVGKLEVLAADVTVGDGHSIGEAYKALYVISGDAVFTVDLNLAEISYSEDGDDVYIWIPSPELELHLDQSSTQKLAEVQKFSLTVGAEDGLKAYLSSMEKLEEKAKENIANYEALMDDAKESAKTQVGQLATVLSGKTQHVHVEFK